MVSLSYKNNSHFEWMAKLAVVSHHFRRNILLEGQMRLSFVLEAAAAASITNYALILVDCDDATRTRRLTLNRRSPELANSTMMDWAKYLRGEANQLGCNILDTSITPLDVCVEQIWAHLGRESTPSGT
jgi:hypothetical protein